MDQVKIGRFIAQRRKANQMTQLQLAEKLGITDRAVSKWENGRSMPDAALMPELCQLLGITINDLFNGEVTDMENYNEKTEKLLLEMAKEKEQADKRLLTMEIVIGAVSTAFLLAMVAVGSIFLSDDKQRWIFFLLLGIGFVQFIICMQIALRIEQVAGYYECQKCGHKHVPSYGAVTIAMHMGRTRWLKCPHCGKWSWNKKVLKKD